MFLTLAVVAAVGAALLRIGLRGRRTDDHPLCRRCRFDLTGKPAQSTRCAECGADLGRPRAVRVGHRRRRTGPLAIGTALLAVAVGTGAVVGYGRARHIRWLAHAPLWYLLRQAGSDDAAEYRPAFAELYARGAAGRWSADDWDRVVAAALAHQADRRRPWEPAWGSVIETAADAGHVPADRWRQYARQALCDEPTVDGPTLGPGRHLSWQVNVPAARLADYSRLGVFGTYSFDFGGETAWRKWGLPGGGESWGPGFMTDIGSNCLVTAAECRPGGYDLPDDLAAGHYTLRVELKLAVGDAAPNGPDPVVEVRRPFSKSFDVPAK